MSTRDHTVGRDPMSDTATSRMFPLQTSRHAPPGPVQIPWSVAEKAYGAYAREYGRSQSLERLAERGGFGWCEMDTLYPNWREEVSEIAKLKAELGQLRAACRPSDEAVAAAKRWASSVSIPDIDDFVDGDEMARELLRLAEVCDAN